MAIYRRFFTSGCLQYTLLAVLLLTLVFNVAFVLDNGNLFGKKFQKNIDEQSQNHQFEFNSNLNSERSLKGVRKLKIEAKSSKSSVYVSVDGLKVYEDNSEGDISRGIHIVVISEVAGTVMAKRVFDTYLAKEDEAMVLFLNMITDGRIVLFMIKDEGTMNLKKVGKEALNHFGSRFANDLGWRSSWAFISKKRNTWLAEAHQKAPSFTGWGSAVVVQASVPLVENTNRCDWGDDDVARRRKRFCSKYEGYGSVCSCTNPAPINLRGEPLRNSNVDNLPIAVIASNRPHYLFRMLRGLLSTPGVDPKMVVIFIDGFYDEPSAIAELFQVSVVEHMPICSKNCRISQHYKRSLYETFTKYDHAEYMIILEEDLDVSKDLMDYFSQLLPIYGSDDSVYCISAWNDQGYEHSSHDPSMLYRVETMPGLGWVLKKSLFMDELYPKWPGSDKFWDWDMWMRMDGNRKGRECIVPDISRTYHFGVKGLNMNSFFQDMYFTKHALNTRTGNEFDVSTMYKEAYEQLVESQIRIATILDHTQTPCSTDSFVPSQTSTNDKKIYVYYIYQKQAGDYETWNNVARCFKLWDLDVRGFHKQMWRFWIKESQMFVVGSSSPYFKFKPEGVTPIFIKKRSRNKGANDKDDDD